MSEMNEVVTNETVSQNDVNQTEAVAKHGIGFLAGAAVGAVGGFAVGRVTSAKDWTLKKFAERKQKKEDKKILKEIEDEEKKKELQAAHDKRKEELLKQKADVKESKK